MKACVGVLLVLGAAEMAARRWLPQDALTYRDSDNPRLGVELLPGASGMKAGAAVSINADGLRQDPLPTPKPEHERRVVVAGGQETFGLGVDESKTFVRVAESGLEALGRVRTVNLSMYSYNLAQKVELVCEKLPRIQPEVVVLQASDHDSGGLPQGALNAPHLKNWLRGHSALARRAAEAHYLRPMHGSALPTAASHDADKEATAAQEQLRRFQDCVKRLGAFGAVMMISDPAGDGAVSGVARGLRTEAEKLGLPYIDAGPAIRRLPQAERTLGPASRFLSPAAHRATAHELHRILKPLLHRRKAMTPPTRPSS
ncbi:MAG: hypothetical protein AAB036_06260 [Elusimicrobiota bacterium]